MNLVFCCEAVFYNYKGNYYSSTTAFDMTLWDRYLVVFDSIKIIARVEQVDNPNQYLIDDTKVEIIPLHRYKGMIETIKATKYLKKELKRYALPGYAYILRIPGHIGTTFANILKSKGLKYGVEVVGDPWDVMSSVGGRLSFILKRIALHRLRRVVRDSYVALYVTKSKLQNRYPVREHINSYAVSDVNIPKSFIADKAHSIPESSSIANLIAVGSLEQLYKAPDIVIQSLSILRKNGIDVKLKWLGGGRYMSSMKEFASELGVSDLIDFLGDVNRNDLESYLERADLFIHISRTEGLPRAIIEAMAKGLPVIGTNVGGIPELITQRCLVNPDNAQETADRINKILNDPSFYNTEAVKNLKNALSFESSILSNLRNEFFREVKRISSI